MSHEEQDRPGCDIEKPWTLTATGRKLYYLDPSPDAIWLSDICAHTSNLCRFTGATSQFYSVAQHLVLVGNIIHAALDKMDVPKDVDYWNQILAGYLHDAAEAYVGDMASPLKCAIRGKYKWIESGILRATFEKFGVPWKWYNDVVKKADNIALGIERYYLMPSHIDWPTVKASEMTYAKPPFIDPITASANLRTAVLHASKQRDDAHWARTP